MTSLMMDPNMAEAIQEGRAVDPTSSQLDTNQPPTEAQSSSHNNQTEGQWFLTENIAGHGPRPEYLESKYMSVEAQAKAYKEARKALGAMSGAPDSYDLSALNDYIDPTNQHLQDFLTYAKENKISQDAVSTFVSKFVDYSKSFLPNEEEEMRKLDSQKVSQVQNWAKSSLSQKAIEALDRIPVSADMIEALDEIRQLSTRPTQLPTPEQFAQTIKPPTSDDVRSELRSNYEKYQKDPIYRRDLDNRFAALVERENRR